MSSVEAWLIRWAPMFEPKMPGLLTGDPAGEAVLRELSQSPDEQVRAGGERGLSWIETLSATTQGGFDITRRHGGGL